MSNFPVRKVAVEFCASDGRLKRIEDLNIKFNIKKMCFAVGNQGRVSIANLSNEDIHYLTTFFAPFWNPSKRKFIKLYAGYENNIALIHEGDIMKAVPSSTPPDVWFSVTTRTGFFGASTVCSKSFYGEQMQVKEVCEKVSGWCKTTLDYKATIQKTIDCFSFSGGITKAVKKLNDIGGINAFEEDGKLVVIDAKNPQVGGIREISETSGMIGIPMIDQFGVQIRMLLDNTVKLGTQIKLVSKQIPSANGTYWVYGMDHSGSTRENEFFTTLSCRRGLGGWFMG